MGAAAPAVTFVKVMTSVLSSVHARHPVVAEGECGSNRRMARSEAVSTVAPSAAPARSVATSKATVRVSPLPKIASRLSASAAEAVSSSGGVRPKSPVTSWAAASPAANASLEPSGSGSRCRKAAGRGPRGSTRGTASISASRTLGRSPTSCPPTSPSRSASTPAYTPQTRRAVPLCRRRRRIVGVITTVSPALGRPRVVAVVLVVGDRRQSSACLSAPNVPVAPTIAHAYDASQRTRSAAGDDRSAGSRKIASCAQPTE